MKKILSVVMALILVASFAACGQKEVIEGSGIYIDDLNENFNISFKESQESDGFKFKASDENFVALADQNKNIYNIKIVKDAGSIDILKDAKTLREYTESGSFSSFSLNMLYAVDCPITVLKLVDCLFKGITDEEGFAVIDEVYAMFDGTAKQVSYGEWTIKAQLNETKGEVEIEAVWSK